MIAKGKDKDKDKLATLLVAMPSLVGGFFSQSVVLLTEQTNNSITGVILNKKIDIATNKILRMMEIKTFASKNKNKILFGGPVESSYMWAIHDASSLYPSSKKVSQDIYITDLEKIIEHSDSYGLPNIFEIGIGLSGWGSRQLTKEIEENSWWRFEYQVKDLFKVDYELRWANVIKNLGINPNNLYDNDINTYQ